MTDKECEIYELKKIKALKNMAITHKPSRIPTGFKDANCNEISGGDILLNPFYFDDWVVQYYENTWVATLLYYNYEREEFEIDMNEDLIGLCENFAINGNIYDL